jgi:hypothetical protein
MTCSLRIALVLIAAVALTKQAGAQESKAAKYTREKLKQVIDDFDSKDIGAKDFFEDVNRELTKSITFKIDTNSGMSNNTKITYKAKKVTVEKLLNDISDKNEFGWYVISDPANNKVDGAIMIRRNPKGKERGYELGKEPKTDKSSLETPQAERDFKVAEFYRRTGHPGSACFYYELVSRRYPGTAYADLALQRKLEIK